MGNFDLVFLACDQDSLLGLYMQDYTSLCVQQLRFVPHWLISTHTQTDSILTSLHEQFSQLS